MMRVLPWIVVVSLLAALAGGCRTVKPSTSQTIILKGDTVIRERVVTIVSPADSARIKALMRCDENGRILLQWYEQEVSNNIRLRFKIDSLGSLLVDFDRLPDTVYVPVADTTINSSSDIQEVGTVEVERNMKWWEKYLMGAGILVHGIIIGLLFKYARKFLI